MKRDLVYTHTFVLSFNPGNTDLPLLLDRIERLDLHLQVHQLQTIPITTADQGSTTLQFAVIPTKPPRAPFIAILISY